MDPFTLAFAGVGLATSLFGGLGASSAAKHASEISGQIAGIQQLQNNTRQQMMEVQGRRSQLETMRNAQRARAQAVQSGVNQGAQFGSGLAGGLGQIAGEEAFGLQGINQNLMAGRQMFGYENQISGLKGQLSQVQGQEATDQGIATLGGAIMKSAPMFGPMASQGFGNLGSSIFGAANSGGMLFQS